MTSTISFQGRLSEEGSHALVELPKSVSGKLPSGEEATVEGILNGFPFRGVLEPGGCLKVSEAVRVAARADDGGSAAVEITRVGEEAETRVPSDLAKALKGTPVAQATWEDITPLARRDWILWITTAKQAGTRENRIEKACDMLASGKRRVCCFPGLNWLTKDHVTPDETWAPLSKSGS